MPIKDCQIKNPLIGRLFQAAMVWRRRAFGRAPQGASPLGGGRVPRAFPDATVVADPTNPIENELAVRSGHVLNAEVLEAVEVTQEIEREHRNHDDPEPGQQIWQRIDRTHLLG